MKLMFAAVLTKLLLDKKFSTVQWVSIFLLIMCLVVSKLDMFLDCQPRLTGAKRSLMTRGLLAAEDQADAEALALADYNFDYELFSDDSAYGASFTRSPA